MPHQTSSFNLKVVIQETGLNADTLRAWERRYGLPNPERTPGGHRLYSLRDIQMLNWFLARQKEGLSISRAVELWRNLEADGQDPLPAYTPQKLQVEPGGTVLDDLCHAWVNACLAFEEQAAERILSQAFSILAPEMVCTGVLQNGLALIGRDWYSGKASVQQEHFASALAMRRLHSLYSAAPLPNRPGRILAACPPGEEHEFGLLLLTVLLRRRGWDVVYLGANVPVQRLESALHAVNPFLVISLAQTLPAAASLRLMGEFLTSQGVRMAFGGGIINSLPSTQEAIPGYFLGVDLAASAQIVESLWNLKPHAPPVSPLPPGYSQALQHYIELYPLINIFVTHEIPTSEISPVHMEIALTSLQKHLQAALELGDIHFVVESLGWLEQLLVNHGLPKDLLQHFLLVYWQALETHLPGADQGIFSGLFDTLRNN